AALGRRAAPREQRPGRVHGPVPAGPRRDAPLPLRGARPARCDSPARAGGQLVERHRPRPAEQRERGRRGDRYVRPMILIGSANATVGMAAGWEVLTGGGSALDAVEAAVREVESNPADHTVGFSGYPNLLGEVELD